MPGEPYIENEEDDEPIAFGLGADANQRNLGPDARDADLMDGTWEQGYYARQRRSRDWTGIMTGLGLLVLLGMLLPALLVFFR